MRWPSIGSVVHSTTARTSTATVQRSISHLVRGLLPFVRAGKFAYVNYTVCRVWAFRSSRMEEFPLPVHVWDTGAGEVNEESGERPAEGRGQREHTKSAGEERACMHEL
jgi:hypothetical protein